MPRRTMKGRRRFRRRRRRMRIPRRRLPPVGMPSKQLVRLRYCDEITLDPVAGAIQHYNLSANGMFDPDITAVLGHQPLYFDQYMANYDHYTVIGSRIRVTCVPHDAAYATQAYPGAFGVNISDDPTFLYSSFPQIVESNQNRGYYRSYSNSLTGANTKGKAPSIVRKFSAKKFFQAALTDSNKGTVATNPTDQAYYQVWASSVDSNDPSRANFLVEIEYIALLTEPKFIARS